MLLEAFTLFLDMQTVGCTLSPCAGAGGPSPAAETHDAHRLQLSFLLFHRITESQNSRGWKGPLWVI